LDKFKWGRLNEKHLVATWGLGHHLSVWLEQRENKKTCESFIYSPTDASVSCLKNNIKIYIKIDIKTDPTCFGAVSHTIIKGKDQDIYNYNVTRCSVWV
jgi:hypothetical protein